ncbi:MAG: GGDEF domain-containing protein [Nitrospira sp.]|nr:GGDEF domain-containing protein [Candidatus Brocadiales bacterium]MBL7048063.1 GGDEF domain-containing protein [Nitrospira sp.]
MSTNSDLDGLDYNISSLEKKIYIIADEVLDILKNLSHENQQQLNTKLIAERMFIKDTVKKMLSETGTASNDQSEFIFMKEIANNVLDRFSQLAPLTMNPALSSIKDRLHDKSYVEDTAAWLDSTIKIVKKYFNDLADRNTELANFIVLIMKHLEDTELHLASELSFHQSKYTEDRTFENEISVNMKMLKQDLHNTNDIDDLKNAVMGKIENINVGIERKREQDMLRLRETESTLNSMGSRIKSIKSEADQIKKKAEEMEKESFTDKLTGLQNRKSYDLKLLETIANLKRYGVNSSLMICDIDFFKKINDTYGHKAGDLTLKKLALLLNEKLRINDFISRYGGEEFTVILPHTTLEVAKKVADGIRVYIDQAKFTYKNESIPITISIGVSQFSKDDDINTVFERADSALYLAKNSGRNNVKTEQDSSPSEEHAHKTVISTIQGTN